MIEWAIGSLAVYNALPAATQARFAARYDTIFNSGAWAALEGVCAANGNTMPDDYSFVYIESGIADYNISTTLSSIYNLNNGTKTLEITALDQDFYVYSREFSIRDITAYDATQSVSFKIHGFNLVAFMSSSYTVQGLYARLYGDNCSLEIYDMGVYSDGYDIYAGNSGIKVLAWNNSQTIRIYNCKVKYFSEGIYVFYTQLDISVGWDNVPVLLENCTVYQAREGLLIGPSSKTGNAVIRNCYFGHTDYGFDPDQIDIQASSQNLLGVWDHNADSDGTLPEHTGVQHNVVAMDELNTTNPYNIYDPTEPIPGESGLYYVYLDYLGLQPLRLLLYAGADPERGKDPLEVQFTAEPAYNHILGVSGTAPEYATTDYNGYDRPGSLGYYAIGAHEA